MRGCGAGWRRVEVSVPAPPNESYGNELFGISGAQATRITPRAQLPIFENKNSLFQICRLNGTTHESQLELEIVGENWSRSRLGKTKITQELAGIDHLLNYSRGKNKLSFSCRQGNSGLLLGTLRNCCTIQHENKARSRPMRVRTTSPI